MKKLTLILIAISCITLRRSGATEITTAEPSQEEPPEGYYAFVESPNAEPPRVRPPPYSHAPIDCREDENKTPHVSPFNLCGDLNKGTIPRNPMGQNVMGSPYPFELIRNMTLKYLSRTLPILKADETLPKVAQLQDDDLISQNTITPFQNNNNDRVRRDANTNDKKPTGEENNMKRSKESADELLPRQERRDEAAAPPRYEGPPTPCPAKVEYATPVFAKNYQGVWRYVVQIPYEGYFTQTVEVTRCLQSRCHYLDGGCLSSPRWSSLLVAEIYYPDTVLSNSDTANPPRSPVAASQPPSVQDFQNYQQYLHKRAGLQAAPADSSTTSRPTHCDGVDALGCFQVRLYYDWFLIPGSCKCWRPDYFNKYVRRKSNSPEL